MKMRHFLWMKWIVYLMCNLTGGNVYEETDVSF